MQNFFLSTVIQYVKDHIFSRKLYAKIKAGPSDCVPLFDTTYKKAGLQSCCSAFRGSGIAFRKKQQHRSPRRTYI